MKECLGGLLPVGLQGWPLKFVQHIADATSFLHRLQVHLAAFHFSRLGSELSSVAWSTGAKLIISFCLRFSVVLFDRPGISISS